VWLRAQLCAYFNRADVEQPSLFDMMPPTPPPRVTTQALNR